MLHKLFYYFTVDIVFFTKSIGIKLFFFRCHLARKSLKRLFLNETNSIMAIKLGEMKIKFVDRR